MSSVLSVSDFYIHDSVLHPIAVGIPLIFLLWLYLRMAPNRVLAPLTKFDWIVSVTLGSTLSRIVTGSAATHLDFVRGVVSLAVISGFQLAFAYLSIYVPRIRGVVRAQPSVVVFRGRYVVTEDSMRRGAVLTHDVRIWMRSHGILRIEDVEVMLLEAGGGVSIVTTEMMQAWRMRRRRCKKQDGSGSGGGSHGGGNGGSGSGSGRNSDGGGHGDGGDGHGSRVNTEAGQEEKEGEHEAVEGGVTKGNDEDDDDEDEDVPESLIDVTQYAALCKAAAAAAAAAASERRRQEV